MAAVFNQYPKLMKEKLLVLRQIIFDVASEIGVLNELEETLKWGEPSYLTKNGSTIRISVKSSTDECAMYFNCKSKLIDTFKELHNDLFSFEGNRAILFGKDDVLPLNELKHCIALALTYHRVKHLPLLGS